MSVETPFFVHDCSKCTFLGRVTQERPAEEHKGIEALRWAAWDLYFCPQHGLPTVIARFGHAGPDYVSGLAAADAIPVLGEARRRAQRKGLIT